MNLENIKSLSACVLPAFPEKLKLIFFLSPILKVDKYNFPQVYPLSEADIWTVHMMSSNLKNRFNKTFIGPIASVWNSLLQFPMTCHLKGLENKL